MQKTSVHLILGASGFLGASLARHLKSQGHYVLGLDLRPLAPSDADHFDEFYLTGMEDFDYSSLTRVGVVHHTSSSVPLAGDFFQENVEANSVLIPKLKLLAFDHLIYYSTSAVSGTKRPVTSELSEDDVGPIEDYGRSKLAAENLLRESFPDRLIIIRPRAILGPGRRGLFSLLFRWLSQNKTVVFPGPLSTPFQFLHIDDLLRAVDVLIAREARGIFNVGGRPSVLASDLDQLKERSGSTSGFLVLPEGCLWLLDLLCRFRILAFARWQYLSFSKPHFLSTQKLEALGWRPRWSNVDALMDTWRSYEGMPLGSSPHRKTFTGENLTSLILALRPLHWSKNLLIFLPVIFSRDASTASWSIVVQLFGSWCALASGVYLLNDLLDRGSDATHPVKKFRAIASGELSPSVAGFYGIIFLGLSFLLAPQRSGFFLVTYLAANIFYSSWGKKIPFLDLFLLTTFYLLRIQSGFILTSADPTIWLFGGSLFFFFGLSSFKRSFDLSHCLKRRGYRAGSEKTLSLLGLISWSILSFFFVGYIAFGAQSFGAPWILGLGLLPLLFFSQRVQRLLNSSENKEFLELILSDTLCLLSLLGVAFIYALAALS